ncbi:MAG: hypothetical protein J6R01_07075 [Alistipes sp.]|nr:hypothetical protein [Alistipes sp.]MBO7051703.1 hypothetical protein [Prevotella sp.]
MAILKSLVIRGASKRLGGMVLYSRAGETIARELAPAVSNPRTRVQMEQRIKLGNVVAMYRANRSWMAGAFEDKKENESDYNAFVRMNLSTNNVALTKGHIAAGAGVVAPYQVTSGSIPSIEHVAVTTGVTSNIYTGTLVLTSATTVGQFTAAILANNNIVEEGMQLSLIVNLQRRNEALSMPYIVLRKYEVLLKLDNTQPLSEYIPLELLAVRDSDGHPLAYVSETLGDGAACFVLSHTVAGKTKVSSQTLVLYGNQSIYGIYTSAIAVNAAIESYGTTEERFLDTNEAREARQVVIDNYIQALNYAGNLYQPNAVIPVSFDVQRYFVLYFAQPVASGATISLLIGESGEPIEVGNLQWEDNRTRAVFYVPGGHAITEATLCAFLVEAIDETLEFDFTANPGVSALNAEAPDTRSKKK